MTAGWHAFNISSDRGSGIGAWNDKEIAAYLSTGHASGRGTAAGPMGEAVDQSFSFLAPADIKALVVYLRSVPAVASSEPGTIAPPAPPLPKQGSETADILGRRVFEGACVSCHNWTGVSAISPYATIAGTRAVNDPHATNVAQIVISGTTRHTPSGILSMPAFGGIYSDAEIAAVANYVTQRFGDERRQFPTRTWPNCGIKLRIDLTSVPAPEKSSCPSSNGLGQSAVFGTEALARLDLSLGGFQLMLQSSQFDSVAFDSFSFQKDGLASAEVDVGRCQVL